MCTLEQEAGLGSELEGLSLGPVSQTTYEDLLCPGQGKAGVG